MLQLESLVAAWPITFEQIHGISTPFLLVLFLVTFIDATIHNGYFLAVGGCLAQIGVKPVVQVLHGICYAFFFATIYIFIDVVSPKDVYNERPGPVQPADPPIG